MGQRTTAISYSSTGGTTNLTTFPLACGLIVRPASASRTDLGRADVAYTIANQRTFPGWGHMLENGATTLWEHWEFSDNTFSHNHPMFGSVSEWFYRVLAGINAAPGAVGFDKIIIRSVPDGATRRQLIESGDIDIACQVRGGAPLDLIMTPGYGPHLDHPSYA